MSGLSIDNLNPMNLSLPDGVANRIAGAGDQAARDTAAKIQVAKDFESVLIQKLMEEMQKTVSKSGLLEDEGSEQTQSIVWMQLSQDIANKGGIGLWKQIYTQMNGNEPPPAAGQLEHVR